MTTAFWIASSKYVAEASKSCDSLKRHMPDLHCVLFASDAGIISPVPFNEVVSLPARRYPDLWYLDSTHYFLYALEHIKDSVAVYLDVDTYICAPFYDFIQLLEAGFDFVSVHSPGRKTTGAVQNIPDAFPEVNIGVQGFNINARTLKFMRRWLSFYEENKEVYGNNDQGSLRDALWECSLDRTDPLRVYVAPQEYNCRLFGAFVRYQVKVLHGRADNMEQIAADINREAGTMRVWKPT